MFCPTKSLFLVLALSACLVMGLGQPCSEDVDCHYNEYCYDSNLCATCENCTKFHRQYGRSGCAKEPIQCGDCLPGFEENPDKRFDGQRNKYCIDLQKTTEAMTKVENMTKETTKYDSTLTLYPGWLIGLCVGIFVLMILIAGGIIYSKCRTRYMARSITSTDFEIVTNEKRPQGPSPTAPGLADFPRNDLELAEKPPPYELGHGQNTHQKATPYQVPTAYVTPPIDIDGEGAVGGQNLQEEDRLLPNDDENTRESDWTPASTTTANLRTNFLGALNGQSAQPSSGNRNETPPQEPTPAERPSKRMRTDNNSNNQIVINNNFNVFQDSSFMAHDAYQRSSDPSNPRPQPPSATMTLSEVDGAQNRIRVMRRNSNSSNDNDIEEAD